MVKNYEKKNRKYIEKKEKHKNNKNIAGSK